LPDDVPDALVMPEPDVIDPVVVPVAEPDAEPEADPLPELVADADAFTLISRLFS